MTEILKIALGIDEVYKSESKTYFLVGGCISVTYGPTELKLVFFSFLEGAEMQESKKISKKYFFLHSNAMIKVPNDRTR